MIGLNSGGNSIVLLYLVFKEGLLPRFTLCIAVLIILFTTSNSFAGKVSLSEAMSEKSIGDPNAPVTMIEYSSLTCSHCADFHIDTLPKIKKEYIDTGKVRMVFWDFPLGNLALAATMIARCSGHDNYIPMTSALYLSQKSWAQSDAPFDAIAGIARLSGMNIADIENCLNDQSLLAAIQAKAKEAENLLGVESTPTFFIDGKIVPGNLPYKNFKILLDKALARKP